MPSFSWLVLVLPACSLVVAAVPAAANPTLVLGNVPAEQAAREVSRAFGIRIELHGGANRWVDLSFADVAAPAAVARLSTALNGSWRKRLRVRSAEPAGMEARPSLPSPVLTLAVQDLPARRAFALVARQLGVELEIAPGLERRVSIAAVGAPAHTVLDRIAEQSGTVWEIYYRIDAPDAPAPPAPKPSATAPSSPRTPASVPVQAPPPVPQRRPPGAPATPALAAPSGEALRELLQSGIDRILRVEPAQRGAAIREFIRGGEEALARVARLSAGEREKRLAEARAVMPAWLTLYRGLSPSVQKELAGLARFLENHLGK